MPTPSDIRACETHGWDGDNRVPDENYPLRASQFDAGTRYRHSDGDVMLATWRIRTRDGRAIVGVVVEGDAVGDYVFDRDDDWYAEVGE
jgi:hypothetical protein